MTCDEFEEILGAYALDAVTPAEQQEVEAHLATCARCTQLLQELRGVVSLLPLAMPQINPPVALEERILAAVRQESKGGSVQPVRQQPQQPIPMVRPIRRTQRWNPRVLVTAAVLMLCLLGGLTAWNVSLHGQVATLQQKLTQVTNTPNGVTSYAVKGTSQSQNVAGQLVYFAEQNITVLVMHGLPQLQGLHVYQGWLVHLRGKNITSVTSVGLLNPLNGTATLSFPGNVTGYDAAAISLEPGPTATPKAPKGSVVALGTLQTNTH